MDKLRALVIEDNLDDYATIVRELKRKFVPETRRVETEAALSLALISPWDVILCDYVINWRKALQLAQDRMCNVPFIIVTGRDEGDAGLEALRAGVWDVLSKVHITRLCHIVSRELLRASSLTDYYAAHQQLMDEIKSAKA